MARVYYQHMTQVWSLKRHKSDNTVPVMLRSFDFFKAFCQGCLYRHLLIVGELDHWRHHKMHLAAAFLHHYCYQGFVVLDFLQSHLFYVCMFLGSHSLCVCVRVRVHVSMHVWCECVRRQRAGRELKEVGGEPPAVC